MFAAGEGAGGLFEAFAEPGKEGENVFAGSLNYVAVILQVGTEGEVFRHGEVGKNQASLGDVAQPAGDDFVGCQPGDLDPVKANGSGPRADQAGDGLQGGGLAGSVAADEGHNGATGNLKGDAVNGLDRTIGDGKIGDGQHGLNEDGGDGVFNHETHSIHGIRSVFLGVRRVLRGPLDG